MCRILSVFPYTRVSLYDNLPISNINKLKTWQITLFYSLHRTKYFFVFFLNTFIYFYEKLFIYFSQVFTYLLR